MAKINSFFLLLVMFVLASFTNEKSAATEGDATNAQSEKWITLLQGNKLDQWEMYSKDSIKGWSVVNGELHSSGAGWDADEDIVTKESFSNFELVLDWKITTANSSGIFYYVQKDSGHPIYESAPEYQVMDDKGWPQKMKPNQYTSGCYAMYEPIGAKLKPVGEWNATKIIVKYPHVEHWLNGVKVVEYDFGSKDWEERRASGKWADVPYYGKAKSGRIGLQNAGKVIYRNIKVRRLAD